MRRSTATGILLAGSICGSAAAQPVTGIYIGAGALWNLKHTEPLAPDPSFGLGSSERLRFDDGGVGGVGSVGYGIGNGLRLEFEGSYRQNGIRMFATSVPGRGRSTQQDYGVMANALFDFDLRPLGIGFATPYLGVGAGYQWSHLDGLETVRTNELVSHIGGTDGAFAYQGIVGVAVPVSLVPGLAVTAEYRFLKIQGEQNFRGRAFLGPTRLVSVVQITQNLNHSIVVGFRYAFGASPAAPTPDAPIATLPAPSPSRQFLVFFDWDRAELTDRARQIVADAAEASAAGSTTRIVVQGNADRSGSPAYNQALSERRARVVAGELIAKGVAAAAITIEAFGSTRPLVPTAAGVREPQNRRVAIILR